MQDRKEAESKKKPGKKMGLKEEGRCRFCLEVKMQIKALAKHVKVKHPNFYVKGSNTKDYVAREGQKKEDDPEWKKTTFEILQEAISNKDENKNGASS